MRVFAALPVPDVISRRLDTAVAPLRSRYGDLRWSRPDGWHVTLAFLGEVEDDAGATVVEAVERGIAAVEVGRVALQLGGAGHFNRRVLWIAVDDTPGGVVSRLGASIQRSVVAEGLPCDEKDVHPHLTLARTRGRARLPRAIVDDVPAVDAAWEVGTALVLRSHLGAGGSRYEELATVDLGRREGPGRGR